ncbi:AAA family ATPase [Chloroflexota bacterium]
MSEIGCRIIICGPTCSGKSTMARQLAQRLDISHIELDALFWKPDWEETPRDEFLAGISAVLEKSPEGWVIDGNYSESRNLTLPLADTLIWLHLPFSVVFRRLLQRTVARCIDHKSLWGTNYETWRQSFFSRESLILYQVTHWRKYERIGRNIQEIPHRATVIELCSPREVDAFLAGLEDEIK